MLFTGSKISVIDNCGARIVKCIKVLGKKKFAVTGDLLLIVVNKKSPNKKAVIKKKVYYGLLVHVCYPVFRLDGRYLKFNKNSLVVLSDKLKFLGTRVMRPVVKEIRDARFKLLLTKARIIL